MRIAEMINGTLVYRDMTPEEEAEYREATNKTPDEQIADLKEELTDYDYIGTKIAMGVATVEEYAEQIAYTETLRQRIRELEAAKEE